jgi:hypothetical protein
VLGPDRHEGSRYFDLGTQTYGIALLDHPRLQSIALATPPHLSYILQLKHAILETWDNRPWVIP